MTGLVLLSDAETGLLEAVLDAGAVTALRTAAAGVLAADTLCRRRRVDVGVVGCGVNGAETARMLVARGATPLVWDVDEGRRELVAETARGPGGRCRRRGARLPSRDHGDARRGGALPAGSLAAGQHVSLMGADGPGKAEVAVEELGARTPVLRRLGAGEPRRRAGGGCRGGARRARR